MDDSLLLERRPAIVAWFFLVFAAVLLTVGLGFQQTDFVVGAILPFMLMVCVLLTRPAEMTLYFGPDSISDVHHQELIRYDEIVGLTIAHRTPDTEMGRFPGGRLIIAGQDRNYEFPQLKSAAARLVYNKLLDRIPETGTRKIDPGLHARLLNDLQLFEDDLVFSYRARRGVASSQREANWFLFAMTLGGIVWFVVGIVQSSFWIAAGIGTISVAFFCWLLVLLSRRNDNALIPNREFSSLIVSPRGIALTQGHLKGELKWSEVRSLNCERAHSGTLVVRHPSRSISISVAGAQIMICDIYDRPLATIFRCMKRYWETP